MALNVNSGAFEPWSYYLLILFSLFLFGNLASIFQLVFNSVDFGWDPGSVQELRTCAAYTTVRSAFSSSRKISALQGRVLCLLLLEPIVSVNHRPRACLLVNPCRPVSQTRTVCV